MNRIEDKDCLSDTVGNESPTGEEEPVCPGIPASRSHEPAATLGAPNRPHDEANNYMTSARDRAVGSSREVVGFPSQGLQQGAGGYPNGSPCTRGHTGTRYIGVRSDPPLRIGDRRRVQRAVRKPESPAHETTGARP